MGAVAGIKLMLAWALSCTPTVLCQTVSVNLTQGVIQGRTQDGVNSYLGVPYAAPPVGSRRWAPPAPYVWNRDVINATEHPPVCPQPRPNPWLPEHRCLTTSEDCLYLSIYTPAKDGMKPAPVLVFIHGGRFEYGGAAVYDGSDLAKHGVIVVTVNYRLGPLGFMMSKGGTFATNLGLRDQIAALQWVQRFIQSFNGDVNQVVLAGHEAGAESVTFLMTSPLAAGLYQRVIAMGAVGPLGEQAWGNPSRLTNDVIEVLALRLHCPYALTYEYLNCLRKKNVQDIVSQKLPTGVSWPLSRWRPQADGKDFPDPNFTWNNGSMNRVPLLIGNDAFLGLQGMTMHNAEIMSEAAHRGVYRDLLSQTYSEDAVSVLLDTVIFTYHDGELPYHGGHLPSYPKEEIQQVEGDMFNFGMDLACRAYANHVNAVNLTLYKYVFDNRRHAAPLLVSLFFGESMVAIDDASWTYADKQLSDNVTAVWLDFIKTGEPGSSQTGRAWPVFNSTSQQYLHISQDITVRGHYRQKYVTFWESVVPGISSRVAHVREKGRQEASKDKPSDRPYFIATWVLLSLTAFFLLGILFLIALMIYKSSDDYDMTTTPSVKYVAK